MSIWLKVVIRRVQPIFIHLQQMTEEIPQYLYNYFSIQFHMRRTARDVFDETSIRQNMYSIKHRFDEISIPPRVYSTIRICSKTPNDVLPSFSYSKKSTSDHSHTITPTFISTFISTNHNEARSASPPRGAQYKKPLATISPGVQISRESAPRHNYQPRNTLTPLITSSARRASSPCKKLSPRSALNYHCLSSIRKSIEQ